MEKKTLYAFIMFNALFLILIIGGIVGYLNVTSNKAEDDIESQTNNENVSGNITDTVIKEEENQILMDNDQSNLTDMDKTEQKNEAVDVKEPVEENIQDKAEKVEKKASQEEVLKEARKYDYVSSDQKWAVNKSYFACEYNSQKSDCMLYSTDMNDQYNGALVMEVVILYSDNISIYLDLNLSKLESKEYSNNELYRIDDGSVASVMYVDNRKKDSSGWMLPAPYCYYKIATGVEEEGEIIKKFDAIELKIDYIDYVKDALGAYLSFEGPDVEGETVDVSGYFVADIPFAASSEALNINPASDSGSDLVSGIEGYVYDFNDSENLPEWYVDPDDFNSQPTYNTQSGSGTQSDPASASDLDCPYCYVGECTSCNGAGWYINGYTGDRMDCSNCNNSGKCPECGGNGHY